MMVHPTYTRANQVTWKPPASRPTGLAFVNARAAAAKSSDMERCAISSGWVGRWARGGLPPWIDWHK